MFWTAPGRYQPANGSRPLWALCSIVVAIDRILTVFFCFSGTVLFRVVH